jgi:MSHA biogenesis protein MshQ
LPTATSGWSTSVTANGSGKAISISGGNATLTLAKPTSGTSAAAVGSVDIGINLGSAVSDASCLSTPRPSTTGAGLSWLRAQFGSTNSCFGVVDYLRDPSSRATFGVYAPELQRAIHAAEVP